MLDKPRPGEHLSGSARINILRLKHRFWVLNNAQLDFALLANLIDIPKVSAQQLEKLDRGEILVKVLALIQIIYLIVQLIACYLAHLSSAQLEIATLAFSASSMITYLIY